MEIQSNIDFKEAWKENSEIFVLYRYQPSLSLAIVALICFLISTCVHIFQLWKHRTYYFIPLIIGGIFEWTGYIGRILAHFDQYHLDPLLLLGPTLLAATIYMILRDIINATHAEHCSPIRANWLTKVFISGDVLAFLVQGGGMPPIVSVLSEYIRMVTHNGPPAKASTLDAGRNIVVSGLVLQIVFFSLFILTCATFHYRVTFPPPVSNPTASRGFNFPASPHIKPRQHPIPLFPYQRYLVALYVTSLMILTRSIFRVVEFLGGHAGRLMAAEYYLYVFDATLMLGVMIAWNVFHPGRMGGEQLVRRSEGLKLDDLPSSSDGEIAAEIVVERKPHLECKEAGRVGPMATVL